MGDFFVGYYLTYWMGKVKLQIVTLLFVVLFKFLKL